MGWAAKFLGMVVVIRLESAGERAEARTGYALCMPSALDIPEFRDARSSQPRLIRGLNFAGRLLPGPKPIEAEAIWAAARKGSLSDCEPTPEARAALESLTGSLAANTQMTQVGRFSAMDDTVRMARTHLRIHKTYRTTPEILTTELPPPVFIVGWPRTGTTFLHQLLAKDPVSRTIPYWESFDPVPPIAGATDRRIEKLDKMLGQLRAIAPRYDAIHPMESELTEECVALFMNEFRTLQFDFQYRVPEYAHWLLRQDAGIAYDLYRQQLQLIQHARPHGARFLLKDPTHLLHLETIVDRFPGAKFIFTHRDPAEAMSSICSLVAYTRSLFTNDVDPRAIGAEILHGYWPSALEQSRKMRSVLPADCAIDVRHADLRSDPLGVAEKVYAGLDLEWTDAARDGMMEHAAERSRGSGARHFHSLETFGLERDVVRERLAPYCDEVNV